MLRQIERIAKRLRRVATFGDGRQVEDRKWDHEILMMMGAQRKWGRVVIVQAGATSGFRLDISWCNLRVMNNDTDIQLSGPFNAKDSSGQVREFNAIRIFDEGYGMIDVYVDLRHSMDDDPLFEDQVLIKNIVAHLHALGYAGPEFGIGDAGLQDDKLIVLEAPEAFNAFAESRGWKNLAAEFADDDAPDNDAGAPAASAQLDALLRKFKGQ